MKWQEQNVKAVRVIPFGIQGVSTLTIVIETKDGTPVAHTYTLDEECAYALLSALDTALKAREVLHDHIEYIEQLKR